MRRTPLAPTLIIVAIAAFAAMALVNILLLTANTPWLGVPLATLHGDIVIAQSGQGIASGVTLDAISLPGQNPVPLEADDLLAEPDTLRTFAELDRFYARQDQLAAILAQPAVDLHLRDFTDRTWVQSVQPANRPLQTLPPSFWVQVATGLISALVSGWIWSLRPRQLAPTLFAGSGLAVLMVVLTSAYYAHRGLAIPADLYRVLMPINHLGIFAFCGTMIGLFCIYPRRLVAPAWLLVIPLLLVPFLALDALHVTIESEHYAIATTALVFLMFALICLQWWTTRRAPDERAMLGWLGLSVALATGLFALTSLTNDVFALNNRLAQHYGAGAVAIIYVGLALGLRRYRLFDLGRWSYRILFYIIGAFLLLGLDALLIAGLNLELAPALAIAILLVGIAYLPLRDWIWRRLFGRQRIAQHELFSAAMDVAFAPSRKDSADRWQALLRQLFDPLDTIELQRPPAEPEIGDDGLSLDLPAVAGAPPLRLHYPFAGSGLFHLDHLKLAQNLVTLTERAEESRQAYMRGVGEERRRMARDLHDDVGARLLTGLHTADARTRPTLQAALSDIRAIVSGLAGEEAELGLVLAQIRHETARRLEAAGIALDWPLPEEDQASCVTLDYRVHKALTSAVREVVSNVIRHSNARTLTVAIRPAADRLQLVFCDDGAGLPASALNGDATGYGLKNLRQRFADLGGSARLETGRGTTVVLDLPLQLLQRTPEPGVQQASTPIDSTP